MDQIISKDGTAIAYVRSGAGTPIVFVTGAFNDHTRTAPLAAALAGEFTTVGYDRRARGRSGDTRPYAVEREVEDLAAVIGVVGGPVALFGYSSGGLLALRAAASLPVSHLVLFEAPFGADLAADLPARLDALVAAGRPGDAVTLFQTEGIGLPAEVAAGIRRSPMFPALEAMARSTVYDATLTAACATPAPVDVPTLLVTGSHTWPMLVAAADSFPGGRHVRVPAADHDIPVPETAAVVREFLTVNKP